MSPRPRKESKEVHLAARAVEKDGFLSRAGGSGQRRLERAAVIKALFRRDRGCEEPFAEIVSLCHTAGAEVVETFSQNIDRVHPGTYLGKGKIAEIAARLKELEVDLVVTDNDLTPAQERNLEKAFERKIVDRSQLIMDIFARRASSLQAQTQVELAQLRYARSRLKRMWTHLERMEGGIGMRGPGETQLETDRRLISTRIQRLQRKLDDIEDRGREAASRRPEELIFALVGYTNVGKSSLLNRLTGASELVEDKLFATLDTRTRKWAIDGRRHVLLKDTVGFIRDLPHHLVASFHATLSETQQADILLHVIDASSPEMEAQARTVDEVLRQLDCGAKPTWILLNKWDRLAPDRQAEARRLGSGDGEARPVFPISAITGLGVDALLAAVRRRLEGDQRRLRVFLPHQRGDLYAFVNRHGKVVSQNSSDQGTTLVVELDAAAAAWLESSCPECLAAAALEAAAPERPDA